LRPDHHHHHHQLTHATSRPSPSHPPPAPHTRALTLQISRALLGDDQRLRLPRFMEDELPKDPEATKQDLIDKIAQLNASIDEVAAQLKSKEPTEARASG